MTMAEVVHRAVETCDDGSGTLDDLLARFEDDDEPVSAVDVERRLDEAVGPRDDEDHPAFTMACAVMVYLAHRRDELDADPVELLRLAARSEFDGRPSPAVTAWLLEQGVEV